jgi:hypothetical protein
MGFMRASTRISNEGLYLDPILVRGEALPGVNSYRAWPMAVQGETIPFKGADQWNEKAAQQNARGRFRQPSPSDASPIAGARRMIERLQQGTVKQ